MRERIRQGAWVAVGVVSLALAGLGVALPLLPTTPFVLVAAFAFARSSERLHLWLLDHDLFGPLIANWQRHRAISRRAKVASALSMLAVLALSLLLGIPRHALVIQVVVLGAVAVFIFSRPAPPGR